MPGRLSRLLFPKSIAVIGGGAWGRAVVQQAEKIGFEGDIWPIHPVQDEIEGRKAYRGVPDLPGVPDAAFVGINREASIGAIERLSRAGAGGAVAFASGFAEAEAQDGLAPDAQDRLVAAAGKMPVLGPNCYGFVNALTNACLWPDQHGIETVSSGVAILTQSSNIAINLSFQNRALPIAALITCGNCAMVSQAEIIDALLEDDRITAIGLHIEGFANIPALQQAAHKAHALGVPLVALKAGRSVEAQTAALSHTASLTGDDAGASALLEALGIGRVDTLPEFLETLTLAHVCGRFQSATAASISCSGGEASLAADLGKSAGVTFPPLTPDQEAGLAAALGPKVALANPLDYHTYIWRDPDTMTAAWSAMAAGPAALTLTIVDIPDAARADPTDWDCAIEAAIRTKADVPQPFGFVSTLPENLPKGLATRLMDAGIAPLTGLAEALTALKALSVPSPMESPLAPAFLPNDTGMLSEAEAKARLAPLGLSVPRSTLVEDREALNLADLQFPVAAKLQGLAHKTEAGGVVLDLTSEAAVRQALERLPAGRVLIEEMVSDPVVELLIGIRNDPPHGAVLTLGAGGTKTELWDDSVSCLLPANAAKIGSMLAQLRIFPLLEGFRGAAPADISTIIKAVETIQRYVLANPGRIVELEVNPLICTPDAAIAADILIRETQE